MPHCWLSLGSWSNTFPIPTCPGSVSSLYLACLLAPPRLYLPPGIACRGPGRAGGKRRLQAGRQQDPGDHTLAAGAADGCAQVSAHSVAVCAGSVWGSSSRGRSYCRRVSHHTGVGLQVRPAKTAPLTSPRPSAPPWTQAGAPVNEDVGLGGSWMYLADSVGQQGHGPWPHQQRQKHLKVSWLQQEDGQRLLCWGALQQSQQQVERTHHLGTQRLTLSAPAPQTWSTLHPSSRLHLCQPPAYLAIITCSHQKV